MLGFPAVTLRSSIERPEALDTGAITMTDLDPATVVAGARFAMSRGSSPELPADYEETNTSERGQLHPVHGRKCDGRIHQARHDHHRGQGTFRRPALAANESMAARTSTDRHVRSRRDEVGVSTPASTSGSTTR